MKKIVTALFAATLLIEGGIHALASDHFGELNLKAGCTLNVKGDVNSELDGERSSFDLNLLDLFDHVFSFAVEYLIPCSHFFQDENLFKFGLGLSYLPSLKSKLNHHLNFSCLPIYFTLQANPFMHSQDELLHRIFIKGNIGYSLNLSDDRSLIGEGKDVSHQHQGGIYYGLSAGYEFPVGIIIDLAYCVYKFGSHTSDTKNSKLDLDYTVKVVALNVGYKFKV
jgi:hypothetical protein